MQVCQLEQYGVPCWSVSPLTQNLLATGTWTNSANEPQSLLRISSYDINKGMNLMGMTLSPTKFSSLDWTDFNNEFGIIAGGMGDGAITLWDARKVLESGSSGNNASDLKMGRGCISAANIHNGVPVTSIEFNPHKKNLLASGGAEVLIQDISHNIKQPNVFKPGVPNYHQGSRITSISWNRVVSHILASASENGKIVVWDLKVNKSIFTFSEPSQQVSSGAGGADDYFDYFSGSGMDQNTPSKRQQQQIPRETCMVWNPEIPTQFIVANDDDQNPSLNIWDLRNPDYPVATFQDVHYNGIQSVSWSQTDPNLLISSAKDFRTVVINSKTGERILEFQTQSAYKKLNWSRPLKGKVCTMDGEGNTSILSMQPEGLFTQPNQAFSTPSLSANTGAPYAPKWLHPKCGARFGFGNKIVTFGSTSGPLIRVHHKPIQPLLAQRIIDFDQSLETMDLTQVLDQKIQESQNDIDKLEFTVMKCIHKNKFDDLLKMFGYDKTKIVQEVEKCLGRKLLKPNQEQQQMQQQVNQPPPQLKQDYAPMTAESAADFFSELGSRSQSGATQSNQQTSNNNNEEQKIGDAVEEEPQREKSKTIITETISKNSNWDEGYEGIIKRNLLIGNLELAAEVALKAGRTTEALLIAEAGGEKIFEKIKEEYFQSSKDSYIKLFLRSIVQDEFKELVSSQALHHKTSNWKESIAYLLSYLEGDEMKTLVHELADELLKKKDINSAIACYMISQSIEIVTDLWKKRALFFMKKGVERNEAMFQLFEKCILFKTVCKSTKVLLDLDLIIADMAEYMASEDLKMLGMKYLELSNPKQANVAFIKDKIYNSDSTRLLTKQFAKPSIPYQVEKVKVHMSIFVNSNRQPQQQNLQKQVPHQQQQQNKQIGGGVGGPANIGGAAVQQHQQQHKNVGQQQQFGNTQQQQNIQLQQPAGPPHQQPVRAARPPGMTDPTLVANFGYNESNKVPLQQQTPTQQQFGGRQPQLNNQQQQHFPNEQQQFRASLPVQQIRNQPPIQMGNNNAVVRPQIFNPSDLAKQQQEAEKQTVPTPGKNPLQGQPKQMIRPPPIGQIRPALNQPPQGNNAMIDQGRPPSSHLHNQSPNQPPPQQHRMPPPMGGSNQPRPELQKQPQQMHQQFEEAPQFQQPPQQQHAPPPGQGVRPRGPAPGGFRPPFGGPPGANQQMGNMPPGGGAQAPPMGMGGPRPVGGQVRQQTPPQQQQQNNLMAGSGGSADASSQEVIISLTNLFGVYTQVELNQKMKQETESKYNLLKERLQEGSVSSQTVGTLKGISQFVEQNNFNAALNLHQELIKNNWQEIKDWSNALKVLITFKQRFTS